MVDLKDASSVPDTLQTLVNLLLTTTLAADIEYNIHIVQNRKMRLTEARLLSLRHMKL
jgi:hypothetical protein